MIESAAPRGAGFHNTSRAQTEPFPALTASLRNGVPAGDLLAGKERADHTAPKAPTACPRKPIIGSSRHKNSPNPPPPPKKSESRPFAKNF